MYEVCEQQVATHLVAFRSDWEAFLVCADCLVDEVDYLVSLLLPEVVG